MTSFSSLAFGEAVIGLRLSSRPDAASADILAALEFQQPEVLTLMVGDMVKLPPALETRLVQLFSRGVARTLAGMDAAIIDSGRQVGVTEMMGQGVADRGYKTPLLGFYSGVEIAPFLQKSRGLDWTGVLLVLAE